LKGQIIPGIRLNKNTCISSILYADDTVIIQESEDELQRAILKLNKTNEEYCLKISASKTKIMALSGKYQIRSQIVIKDDIIEQDSQVADLCRKSNLPCMIQPSNLSDDKDYKMLISLARQYGLLEIMNLHDELPNFDEVDSNNKHQPFRRSVKKKKKRLFSEYYQMLSYEACQSTSNLRGNLARMLFTSGMSFSRSEQMTEASWEGLTERYPVTDPLGFTVMMLGPCPDSLLHLQERTWIWTV
jgi:hypothetical protein